MKRTISLLAAVIMLLAFIVPNGTVFAQEQASLEITDAEGQCGEQVTVAVSIKNSPGFGGMAYDVKYDNGVLKLISYSLGLGKSICTDSGVDTYPDKVNFQYAGTSNVEGDGVLVTLTFEIIGTAEGHTGIAAIPEDGTTFYYENRTEIDFTLEDAEGTVTVKGLACSHASKTSVAAKASDCKEQGWDAYIKCDDCGQLFAGNGTSEITEIPFRPLSGQHTGGNASCTAKAVCSVCGKSYGALASHSYTAAEKKAEALKTEGNCRDKAVYWYSCASCHKVEENDSHTFGGDKVPGTHVGGTTVINQAEANHSTQTDGYTGDTKCLGCGQIIHYGQDIPANAHHANAWSADSEYHWKECESVNCGIVINGSKAKHTSTGANVATCQKKAVCDVCGVSYGELADHNWNTASWDKDADGHWHKCQTAGCTEKNAFAEHTPDHQGGATEEYAIKCTVCKYQIEAQIGHIHVFDKEVAEEQYLAGKASCTEPAKYFLSCECGDKGTETFTYGEAPGHTVSAEWKSDKDNHWNECACGKKSNTAAHKDDNKDSKCDVCGYKLSAAASMTDKESVDSAKPSDDSQSPKTSDSDAIWLWFALLVLSGSGIMAATAAKKKLFG